MPTQSIYSLSSHIDKERKDTIPCRVEFVQELLKNNKLEPLINVASSKDENASAESYDTRTVLKKKFLDFAEIISQIGGKLTYVKSGSTGHTFKGEIKQKHMLKNQNDKTKVSNNDPDEVLFEYAVKVVGYPKKDTSGDMYDVRRPENAELLMIKLLSTFVTEKKTPHIVLPIGTFDTSISTFVDLIEADVVAESNERYAGFIEKYKNGEFYDTVSILISEWANRGDLLDFIRKNSNDFTQIHWKVIFFQILSALAVIQSKYPTFRHNDLKANNVLMHKIANQNDNLTYRIVNKTYKVPNIGYHIKLWDFDFACIPGVVDNKKVDADWTKKIGVMPEKNKYYDVHYFFNTLVSRGFCPELMTSASVPSEMKDFINRIIPKKYQKKGTTFIHKRGRLIVNDEYTTPDIILKNDFIGI